jgi:hypothetical protein
MTAPDEIVYCPRCDGLRPMILDSDGIRGVCRDCQRVSCGQELKTLRLISRKHIKEDLK